MFNVCAVLTALNITNCIDKENKGS